MDYEAERKKRIRKRKERAMNDAKHTRGPWHFAYDGPSLPIVCTENEIIALVRTGRTNENTEIEANARLIAAAPDLLEALTAIRARISGEWDNPALLKFGPLSDMTTDIQIIARTAIRKAEGK